MTGEGFILREFLGIPYYSCLAFEDVPHLRHGFSTRRGGAPDLKESSLNLSDAPWDSSLPCERKQTSLPVGSATGRCAPYQLYARCIRIVCIS